MVRRRALRAPRTMRPRWSRHPSRRGEDAAPQDEERSVHPKAVMSLPATFVIDTPGDAARAAELRRVKCAGDGGAGGDARAVHRRQGAAAACIRRSASSPPLPKPPPSAAWPTGTRWSRLFRRPLGLPIPHTAIIQSNQHRIADKLGEFIELHFLEAAPVEAKLRQIDFGSFIADWLRDRKRSEDLARFALRLLPEAVSATESSGLMTFISRRITTQIDVDRSRAARRRHAARLRAGGPASGLARRHPARDASDADAGGNHGGDPRKDPRRIADAAETLSRRQVSGEPDRRLRDRRSSRKCATIPSIRSAASSTACCCRSSTGSAATRPLPIASTA